MKNIERLNIKTIREISGLVMFAPITWERVKKVVASAAKEKVMLLILFLPCKKEKIVIPRRIIADDKETIL